MLWFNEGSIKRVAGLWTQGNVGTDSFSRINGIKEKEGKMQRNWNIRLDIKYPKGLVYGLVFMIGCFGYLGF